MHDIYLAKQYRSICFIIRYYPPWNKTFFTRLEVIIVFKHSLESLMAGGEMQPHLP